MPTDGVSGAAASSVASLLGPTGSADAAANLPAGLSDKTLESLGLELLRARAAQSTGQVGVSRGYVLRACCDPIYTHPATGASVYCGGWSACDNLEALGSRNIRNVVNCQDLGSANCFADTRLRADARGAWEKVPREAAEREAGPDPSRDGRKEAIRHGEDTEGPLSTFEIRYHRFHINGLDSRGHSGEHEEAVVAAFQKFWAFLDSGLERGESGLIHCAAGMHRAGGASVSYLMHKHGLGYDKALAVAKAKRSVINPYHRVAIKIVEKKLRQERGEVFNTTDVAALV